MYPLPTSSEVPLSGSTDRLPPLPDFEEDERLMVIVSELSLYFVEAIETSHTFEQLKTTSAGHRLKPLIRSLTDTCHHSGTVTALLILKWHFSSLEHDDRQINEARGYACEFVAWRLLNRRPQHELIDCLLSDIPGSSDGPEHSSDVEAGDNTGGGAEESLNPDVVDERTTLLWDRRLSPKTRPKLRTTNLQNESSEARNEVPYSTDEDLTLSFVGSNALEIAAIGRAKSFLSQRVVQKIVDGIWSGDIVFWESLSLYSKKKAHVYNKRRVDPYSRLRIPKYQKLFEALFFVMFLALYYAVLVERNPQKITFVEVFLYIWIAAFAYNEYGEFQDSGTLFYAMDFWSIWDIGIVGIGAAYLIARVVGLIKSSGKITDTSFDILSLEALFLVPRVCSLLSLHPYFGTLVVVLAFSDLRGAQADDVWQIPCLKEMTKDFVKFLGMVVILFLGRQGFLTTFTMLARDSFTAGQIWWMMINVFFGSSSLGFDIASELSAVFGPTLMLLFVVLTNILLLTSLIAILSQSLTKVMDHAREEYLFHYSVFVLEAANSARLTYYFPPLNLIPLVFIRPLRLCISGEQLRRVRIALLKATHLPYIAAIWVYETTNRYLSSTSESWQYTSRSQKRPLIGSQAHIRHRASRYPALGMRSDASLLAKTPGSEGRFNGARDLDSLTEVKRMIEQLSIQVEELSRRVAKPHEEQTKV